jgi:hypothetical protein
MTLFISLGTRKLITASCITRHMSCACVLTDILISFYCFILGCMHRKGHFCSQYCISMWYMLSLNVSIDFSSLMWNVVFLVCICMCVVSSSVYFLVLHVDISVLHYFLYLVWTLLTLSLVCYQKNLCYYCVDVSSCNQSDWCFYSVHAAQVFTSKGADPKQTFLCIKEITLKYFFFASDYQNADLNTS